MKVTRHRRARIAVWTAVVILLLQACAEEPRSKTHITIYLDDPILTEGGAVIIAGMPVSKEEWSKEGVDENLARLDPTNPTIPRVRKGDQHLGVIVRSTASAVEFNYPKEGSYTFNFLPVPDAAVTPARLQTEMLLVGSVDKIPVPHEEGEYYDWPSNEIIHVFGKENDQGFTRSARVGFLRGFSRREWDRYVFTNYDRARTIELTPDGVNAYVRRAP